MQTVSLVINGRNYTATVDERVLLLEFVRDIALLTGTHNGCLEARCGACVVEVDGEVVKSCNVLAVQVNGRRISTVEGLSPQRLGPIQHVTSQTRAGVFQPLDVLQSEPKSLHPLQVAFHQRHALQCGFCTPGMLMTLKNYLERVAAPSRDDVRRAICGNLCRCTGYQHIVDAAMDAADETYRLANAADDDPQPSPTGQAGP